MFFSPSVRPTHARTHGSKFTKKVRRRPPDDDTKWDRSPLRSLPSTALSLGGGESKAFAEAFPESASARSLARRAAGGQKRARVAELFMYGYERDSHVDRHVMRLNELSSDLLCEALR